MIQRRLKQRQKTLLAMIRGCFGSAGAAGVNAPLKPVRVDAFDESGNDATADHNAVRAPNVALLDHREIRGRAYPHCTTPAVPAVHLSRTRGGSIGVHAECVFRQKPQRKYTRPRFVFQLAIRTGHLEVPGGRLSLEWVSTGDHWPCFRPTTTISAGFRRQPAAPLRPEFDADLETKCCHPAASR